MLEIIFHGRGGQGGVTASKLFAESAIMSENYPECSAFPAFGTERRGCPVAAFCRISDQKIWRRSQVKMADIVVALDILLFDQAKVNQLKDEATLILNTEKSPKEIYHMFDFGEKTITIVTADLFQISRDIGLLNQENQPIINTSILGMLTKVVEGIEIENLAQSIKHRFGDNPLSEKNVKAAKMAAEKAKTETYSR